jgi:hypothetical protein
MRKKKFSQKKKMQAMYLGKEKNNSRQVLIKQLERANLINIETIKKTFSSRIIETIEDSTSLIFVLEYYTSILVHPLIGKIYLPFTQEENNIFNSKIKFACFPMKSKIKEVIDFNNNFGYCLKLKLKGFKILKFLLYHIKNGINYNGISINNQIIDFKKKRNIFCDRKYKYIVIDLFDSDDIKDYIVYDENIQYQKLLYKEIICLNLKKSKFIKSSIIGFNNEKKPLTFLFSSEKKTYEPHIKTDHKVYTSTIFLLNDKENEYPLIDSFDTDFNLIIADLKKRLLFTSKIRKIPKTDNKCFKSLGMEIKSLCVLKDGRITIKYIGGFCVYNNKFAEKKEITFKGYFQYHGVLKNGDLLAYGIDCFIFRLTNKVDVIQKFPENCTKYCECKDFIIFLDNKYLSIWKYNKTENRYFFEQKTEIPYDVFEENKNIFLFGENKVLFSSLTTMICYQIIGEKIELIFRYYNKNNNRSTLNRFYPMIYKGKYIFSQDDDVLQVFSLQKSKYIFTTAFPHDYGAIQLFPLFNGNLLLVYSTESYSYDGKKSYSLMEVTIFQNDIFIVQKYEFKVKSIVTQLKDGTIIYNPPDK